MSELGASFVVAEALDQVCSRETLPLPLKAKQWRGYPWPWGALCIRLLHPKWWRVYPSGARRKLKDRLLSVFDPV